MPSRHTRDARLFCAPSTAVRSRRSCDDSTSSRTIATCCAPTVCPTFSAPMPYARLFWPTIRRSAPSRLSSPRCEREAPTTFRQWPAFVANRDFGYNIPLLLGAAADAMAKRPTASSQPVLSLAEHPNEQHPGRTDRLGVDHQLRDRAPDGHPTRRRPSKRCGQGAGRVVTRRGLRPATSAHGPRNARIRSHRLDLLSRAPHPDYTRVSPKPGGDFRESRHGSKPVD
jgi:hypothetical protein